MNIEWRDIEGYKGTYQVSNTGLVKRTKTFRINRNQYTSWVQHYPERIFKPSKDSKGYFQVVLVMNGIKRTARVHRLVAECFLEPPSENLIEACLNEGLNYVLVNHINLDKSDNRVENLEWCSSSHNSLHTVKLSKNMHKKGTEHYNNKLTEKEILEIYHLSKNKILPQNKVAELYRIKQISVSNIKTGKSWSWLTGENNTRRSYKNKQTCFSESIKT